MTALESRLAEIRARVEAAREHPVAHAIVAEVAAPALLAAVEAVRELHRKIPVYGWTVNDCGHVECDGVEIERGVYYCPQSQVGWTCRECSDVGWYADQLDYPCPTIRDLTAALGVEG